MADARDAHLSWIVQQPQLGRRELVRAGGMIGAAALVSACRLGRGGAGLKDEPLAPGMEWLQSIDPIVAAKFPQTDFTGDAPTFPHKWLRDHAAEPLSGAPAESTRIVIIGGGMAGLAAAYLLRDQKPMIVEQAATFGGNSRGESWEGLEYPIGAAAFAKPDSNSDLMRAFFDPLGLSDRWRVSRGRDIIRSGKIVRNFWDGGSIAGAAGKAQAKKLREYLRYVLDRVYPEIPPRDEVSDALKKLDLKSFLSDLEAAVGGPLTPQLRSLVEHYCWSSFGAAASEISAASGLNFYAAELAGTCALPGGNAKVASALLRGAAADGGIPAENFRVGTVVRRVTKQGDSVLVQLRKPDGSEAVIKAEAVIIACPKFIARRLVQDIPSDQADAMAALSYRACLVANVLIDRALPLDQHDFYLVGEDSEAFTNVAAAASKQRTTHVVLGHWAQAGTPSKAVLTLYRSLPYDGARASLQKAGAFTLYRDEFQAQIPGILKALGGATPPSVDKVRVSRWGHPLVVSAPGLIATGTVQRACATIGERIFFCNQDDWALPAMETCLTSALRVAQQIKAVVA